MASFQYRGPSRENISTKHGETRSSLGPARLPSQKRASASHNQKHLPRVARLACSETTTEPDKSRSVTFPTKELTRQS